MGLIYLFSPAAMFCILAWALACKFSQLDNQLKDLKDKNGDLCVFSVRHSLVCQAVLKLQQYFQNVLLALICYIFLGTISYSYFTYCEFCTGNYKYATVLFSHVITKFLVLKAICYVAECLKEKVLYRASL